MVAQDDCAYDVVLTPQFLEDLHACVEYVAVALDSPQAAQRMYGAIRKKVLGLSRLPHAAVSYVSPTSGNRRYKVSYNKYDIHYVIEDRVVRVLGIKHQLQNRGPE